MIAKKIRSSAEIKLAIQQIIIDFFNDVGEVIIDSNNTGNEVLCNNIIPSELDSVYAIAKDSELFTGNIVLIDPEYKESYDRTTHIIKLIFDDLFDNMVSVDKITYLQYFELVIGEFKKFNMEFSIVNKRFHRIFS